MLKLNTVLLLFIVLIILATNSCKKETTPQVYFTTSSATVNRGDQPTVVTVELSQAVDKNVEITFESIGNTPIRFGSYNQIFMLDDSEKCEVTIDNAAFIDTMGHVKLAIGTKSFNLTFTPQFDQFAHAAAQYGIKMTQATNATIRSGSDVFNYNINYADVQNIFSSTVIFTNNEHVNVSPSPSDSCVDATQLRSGTFKLAGNSYKKNVNGNYDLTVTYTYQAGSTKVNSFNVTYNDLPAFALNGNNFGCSNSNVTVSYTAPDVCGVGTIPVEYNCSNGINATGQHIMQYSPDPSPVYGPYYIFFGNISIGGPNQLSISGNFDSSFFHY